MEFRKRGSLTSGFSLLSICKMINITHLVLSVTLPRYIASSRIYSHFPVENLVSILCIVAGSLLLSCLLGVSLTILIILTVFYLRRHFPMPTQFYPNHVKLFSKEQLATESENGSKPDKKLKGKFLSSYFYWSCCGFTISSAITLKDIQFYFPEYECILTFLSCLRYQRKYFRSKFKGCLIALLFWRILSKFPQKSYFSWQHWHWEWILQTNNKIANTRPQGS